MSEVFYSIEKIRLMAREAVYSHKPSSECPFEHGTSHHKHWMTEFEKVEDELHAEVEA